MSRNLRQHIIERTVVLLARKGLQGTSFSQILEDSGAPRGSLYYYFPGGKDELVLEAIDLAGQNAMAVLEKLAGRPADQVAVGFIELWRTILTRSELGAGCAVAAVTVAAEAPELRSRAGDVFRRWRERLGELLEEGGLASERGVPVAVSLIAACEGAVLLSRGEHSMEPFDLVAREQIKSISAQIV